MQEESTLRVHIHETPVRFIVLLVVPKMLSGKLYLLFITIKGLRMKDFCMPAGAPGPLPTKSDEHVCSEWVSADETQHSLADSCSVHVRAAFTAEDLNLHFPGTKPGHTENTAFTDYTASLLYSITNSVHNI
jgi:hypothetical protein